MPLTNPVRNGAVSPQSLVVSTALGLGGEVFQMPNGLAGVNKRGRSGAIAGQTVQFETAGLQNIPKAAVVLLDGQEVYWDRSASVCTYCRLDDRDFFLGTVRGQAAVNDTYATISLNEKAQYTHDLLRDPFEVSPVGTLSGTGFNLYLRNSLRIALDATSEVQKMDPQSVDGFSVLSKGYIEGSFRVLAHGAASNPHVSIGYGDGTTATDALSSTIANYLFLRLDGNSDVISVEGSEFSKTSTGVSCTVGNRATNRVYFTFDIRNRSNILVYINGLRVLSGSTIALDNATSGTNYLLFHVMKPISVTVYDIVLDSLRTRFSEQ